ncbi:MAG: hypothetical protein EYC62_02645 [Alphaproteobacteria bacterium]|nr:MAG: hypothetical protein EYC62_02645 [Alphaproteobacteria bacterium]
MDLNLSAYGPTIQGEKFETPMDHKIQSTSGFQGVQTSVEKQFERALSQGDQSADAHLRKRGQYIIDEKTRRVYYQTKDLVTGDVQKFPSEAQLRAAAALKEQLEKELPTVDRQQEVKLHPPGDILDAKA